MKHIDLRSAGITASVETMKESMNGGEEVFRGRRIAAGTVMKSVDDFPPKNTVKAG
jgi:hypothetical protein